MWQKPEVHSVHVVVWEGSISDVKKENESSVLINLFYQTHSIISHSLYIFNPFFSAVYNQEWLILQTIYVLNKEIWT